MGLRDDYAGEQRGRSHRRHARGGWTAIKAVVLGTLLGAATVFVFCVLDKQPFFWQTAVWEAVLCGLAGLFLSRTSGGVISGGVLFGAAYTGAMFLRQSQYNSIRVFEPYLPAREVDLHGDFSMLGALAICGAFIGFINSLK